MSSIRFSLMLLACLAIRASQAEAKMPGTENIPTKASAPNRAETPPGDSAPNAMVTHEPGTIPHVLPSAHSPQREPNKTEPPVIAREYSRLLMPTIAHEIEHIDRPLNEPDGFDALTETTPQPLGMNLTTIAQASFADRMDELEFNSSRESIVLPVNFQLPFDDGSAETLMYDSQYATQGSVAAFQQSSLANANEFKIGVDLYSAPDFRDGLIVFGKNVAMKIGGYVKADFIYDADPIDSTDSFDTTTIPVNAEPRTNSRFHARQTRLSFDTRWLGNGEIVRIFVEGDFFSQGNTFRLRHAYGEYGALLVGKTWTTFTDVAAAPATLDFEGSVSSINRRQAQARYTFPILGDELTGAVSIEDTIFIIEVPEMVMGESRSPSPDFVARLRWTTDWAQFQGAYLYREVGFQPVDRSVLTKSAGGFNFTAAVLLTDQTKAYSQVLFGEGIGSYRLLPDAAPTSPTNAGLLGMFGWMVGVTHDWNDVLSSNFTYAENRLDTVAFQDADDVQKTTYLAVNLLAQPIDRVTVGIEYLHGKREDVDGESGSANRIQAAFIFELP